LPQRPDGGTMQRVTASQVSFSIVMVSPDTQNHEPLGYATA
jgi:hypothetical protein